MLTPARTVTQAAAARVKKDADARAMKKLERDAAVQIPHMHIILHTILLELKPPLHVP